MYHIPTNILTVKIFFRILKGNKIPHKCWIIRSAMCEFTNRQEIDVIYTGVNWTVTMISYKLMVLRSPPLYTTFSTR